MDGLKKYLWEAKWTGSGDPLNGGNQRKGDNKDSSESSGLFNGWVLIPASY